MAKNSSSQAVINVTTNAQKAQNDIEKMDALLKRLRKTKQLMEKENLQESAAYKKLKQDIKNATQAQKENISASECMKRTLDQLNNITLKNLKQEYRKLLKELGNFSGAEAKQAAAWRQNLEKIKAKINELEGTTGKFGKTHSSVWHTAVRNITAYVGVFGAFNFAKSKITEVIKANNELSDQMADIRKVSGLAMEDIRQLTTNLSKIDTRTTLSELNRIAYAGAKLGFGNQGIEGLEQFTRAANQVNVALKEDLGEEALTALSKITENMGLIKKMGVEQAMLATGSAMFKLASTSTAAAGPIVEVTKRVVPMAKSIGLATSDVLALASTADSLQLQLEVTGTALSKFFAAMQVNHNLIEQTLDIPAGTIESWIKQGRAMDAILLLFDKMKEKGNMSQLQPIVKLMGGEGSRLITVLLSMSQEVDRLRTHLDISREAFKDATAVTEEYNIQQSTAQALLERANNMWRNAFVNPEASESVKELTRSWYDFTKAMLQSPEAMMSIKTGIDFIIGSLKLLIQLIPAFIGFGLVKMIMGIGSALGLATIATEGFKKAWLSMSTAMKSNWIGLAAAALFELIYQLKAASVAASEAEVQERKATQALQEAIQKAEQEIKTLDQLKKQIDNTNISQRERNELLSKVRTDYDIYLAYLGVEIKSVKDLENHYKDLIKVIKQRYAYEEKQQYKRTKMGSEGGTTTNRRMAGADLVKQYKNQLGKDLDLESIQNFIVDSYNKGNVDMARVKGYAGVPLRSSRRNDVTGLLMDFTNAVINELKEDKAIDAAFAAEIGDYDPDKMMMTQVRGDFVYKPDKAAAAAARAAEAEARRNAGRNAAQARRERLQQLRNELKDAEQEAQAIIDKINEFYYLQEETIEQQVADGKLTRAEADQYLLNLKLSKNQSLANARKTIAGKMKKDDWNKYIKDELPRIMIDQGQWSNELAGEIIKTDLTYIHNLLARFNGSDAVLGLRSTASFDKLMKSAAVNERDNAKIRAQIADEVEKILMEYNFVEQAQKSFHNNLIGLGIMKETYEQYVKRIQEETKALQGKNGNTPNVDWDMGNLQEVAVFGSKHKTPEAQLLQQFLAQGSKPYLVNPQDNHSLYVWLKNLMSDYDYDEEEDIMWHTESWVDKGFPQLKEWVQDIGQYLPKIQKFYFSLITWEDEYYDAKKKAYDRSKRLMEEQWSRSGNKQRYDELEWALNERGRQRAMTGINKGDTFGRLGGFNTLEEDPELALYRAKMEAAQLYLQQLKECHADEKLIREAQHAEDEAELVFQEKIMAAINDRITKLQQWTQPVIQMGEQVGQALYDQWHNGESMGEKWQDILKDLGMAWGKTTIQIIEELMMQRVKQNILNKAIEADQAAHKATMVTIEETGGAAQIAANQAANTVLEAQEQAHNSAILSEDLAAVEAETPVNIARGAGKTIGNLGWWGIPLVAVIVTLLTTLLNAALGKSKKSSKTNSSSDTAQKLKLVSGMLTYDEGNVSSYVGTDGHVYNARRVAIPQGTALVTSPIATTVNGQPSLVAERGPEIVIGRRTTRHIMLNEPALLQHLAALEHRRATRYRPYDDGNLSAYAATMLQPQQPVTQQSSTDEQTRQTLEALTAAVIALQARLAQPIEAKINKYGTGGLIDEVQSGLKFMNKYTG